MISISNVIFKNRRGKRGDASEFKGCPTIQNLSKKKPK
jgi:hypothetical protein